MNAATSHPQAGHPVVSQEEWLQARKELLEKEKELTRLKDKLGLERRQLPWVRIEKTYLFDTATGKKSLADLFEHRSQLIVQHFMFGPGWKEGCVGCSLSADHIDGALVHLENHDVSLVVVSRAPLPEIAAFQKRMGWGFRWVSSFGNDFNHDFHVSFTPEEMGRGEGYYNYEKTPLEIDELPGHSVFFKDPDGNVFHTYSTYARGDEALVNTFNFLDLVPLGGNEKGPGQNMTDWVRHHDRYGAVGRVNPDTGRFEAQCGCA